VRKFESMVHVRPVYILLLGLLILFSVDVGLVVHSSRQIEKQQENGELFDVTTSGIGLTDLCVSTEARYTRHPAVSDPVVPFMDHPGAIEHFPTGSFWTAPSLKKHSD